MAVNQELGTILNSRCEAIYFYSIDRVATNSFQVPYYIGVDELASIPRTVHIRNRHLIIIPCCSNAPALASVVHYLGGSIGGDLLSSPLFLSFFLSFDRGKRYPGQRHRIESGNRMKPTVERPVSLSTYLFVYVNRLIDLHVKSQDFRLQTTDMRFLRI
ncbi:hypothetical protein WAI453_005592 [Rhynchosporium graminicola]